MCSVFSARGRYWLVLATACALAYTVLVLISDDLARRVRWPYTVVVVGAVIVDLVTHR